MIIVHKSLGNRGNFEKFEINGTKKQNDMTKARDFYYSDLPEPHIQRTKDMIKKYPEIKTLMGRNPYTFLFILGVVGLQVIIAWFLRDQAWWMVLLVAYVVGAFANHSLFVLIHECAHNMVFKNKTANIFAGILCDIPNAFPSSVGFRKYHLKHHAFQGNFDLDADLPGKTEAKLFNFGILGKSLWMLFFPFIQLTRTTRLTEIKFSNKWTWVNLITVILFDVLIWMYFGPMAFVYFMASFFFSVGFHPLGARWIQEHFLVAPPQETYSYYGWLNILSFNVGYHNEHHDFSFIPWNNLPKLRKMAPEFYNDLIYHTSWTKLWLHWLWDSNLSLYSRTVRNNRGGIEVTRKGDQDFYAQREMKES